MSALIWSYETINMSSSENADSSSSICLSFKSGDVSQLAVDVYERVCRTGFEQPGFCLVDLGADFGSQPLRQLMVKLKREMAAIHERRTNKTLIYLSAGRFDQQTTTRPHLDGGPDESMLMLGYEPTEIAAELEISDYTQCAASMELSPKEFMERHNPMFDAGFELLRPYAVPLRCFNPAVFQIVAINNSSASIDGNHWLGTLHTATILNPDESKRRIINSTMIAPAPIGSKDAISDQDVQDFVHTTVVRRKGYDKVHLEDDR